MLRRFPLLIATVIPFLILCGCGDAQIRPLAQDKVLLNVSLAEKVRLLTRLGFTNMGHMARLSETLWARDSSST